QVTNAKVRGMVRGIGVIGRWKSANREVLYLAVGTVCDGKGNTVKSDDGSPNPDGGIPVSSNNDKTSTWTVVEGAGNTDDEAIRNALRNGVIQVLGGVLDTETIIKGSEVISDNVLTYSRGFVSEYQELDHWAQDGVIHKRIRAKVARQKLAS